MAEEMKDYGITFSNEPGIRELQFKKKLNTEKLLKTTMAGKFSPYVNIIRDSGRLLDYVITPNAQRIVEQMGRDYRNGFHSFTIIGSYGTGKSSFLMALERSIKGESLLDIDLGFRAKKVFTASTWQSPGLFEGAKNNQS